MILNAIIENLHIASFYIEVLQLIRYIKEKEIALNLNGVSYTNFPLLLDFKAYLKQSK